MLEYTYYHLNFSIFRIYVRIKVESCYNWGGCMRVIAGDLKGRKIKAVPGQSTRPTADKIKEALFQVMGPFFNGGSFLDLFAGSGSLGIESLSRGMDFGVFVDRHPKAVHTIKENISQLQLVEKTEVYRTDAFRALKACRNRGLQFDYIFLDPPYKQINYTKLLEHIANYHLLKENGFVYCEHHPTESIHAAADWQVVKQEAYSSTIGVTIFYNVTN